jgi:hypothetical protein
MPHLFILQANLQTPGIRFCSPPAAILFRRQASKPPAHQPAIWCRCSLLNANVYALASAETNKIMLIAKTTRFTFHPPVLCPASRG